MTTNEKSLPDLLNFVYELEAIYEQGQDTSAWKTALIEKQQEPPPPEGTPPPDSGRGSEWDYTSSHTTMPENAEIKVTPRGKEYWLRPAPTTEKPQQAEEDKSGFDPDEYLTTDNGQPYVHYRVTTSG